MSISILIATYGDLSWERRARRAVRSASSQDVEVLAEHSPDATLAQARNALAAKADSEWIVFLDGDDELAPGYIEAMKAELLPGRLLAPSVQYVIRGRRAAPKFWPEVSLKHGNWLVIGTAMERDLFHRVGGFRERDAYEDWELFARAWAAGAEIVKVPDAIYIAHQTNGSRNRRLKRSARVRVHYEIGRDLFPEEYDERWLRTHLRNVR